ncbi:MAG: isomerizing glutamine--fructose-6-phosphate transaminase, partial [Candidatus Aenigmarchaeota archaeon]|nr:isomerizing glutamine--fructose-6-phosphate transaminase [Candidatus Aenigmarchaeota archaeon]
MCGIVGCVSGQEVNSLLLESLKKLEYRGYDSYGFATVSGGRIHIEKDAGKISAAAVPVTAGDGLPGRAGIAHTRWATHGGVSRDNAHPHTDCTGRIAVAHNGIVENYQELRDGLKGKHKLVSDTDTELICHLIEEGMDKPGDDKPDGPKSVDDKPDESCKSSDNIAGRHSGFEAAVAEAVKRIEGRHAIAAISAGMEKIVGVRKGSPLIVGIGKGMNFLASDIPAFLEHTKDVMYIDDNEMVVIGKDRVDFYDTLTGNPLKKRVITIDWDAGQAEKGEYSHYMIKEIMEQKETILRALNQDDGEIGRMANEIRDAFGTFFIGCGTAGRVCLAGEYAFSKIARKHVNYVMASEFPNYQHFLTDKTLVIAVSQSGETADVLEALEVARKKGSKVISIVNGMGSSIERMSDYSFRINAGPERAVASTKATTSQLALITLLAYSMAERLAEGKRLLIDTASKVNDMLNPRYEEHIR